ncbi:hypothetical protein Ccrd_017977, partial [Cynara cardunculus var. scolymus]
KKEIRGVLYTLLSSFCRQIFLNSSFCGTSNLNPNLLTPTKILSPPNHHRILPPPMLGCHPPGVYGAFVNGLWTCVDMTSGHYLWRNLVSASKQSEQSSGS